MSSHHFVKEGQEPALLILDANLTEATASLLEWAPLLLVSASVVTDVISRGIKVDVIIRQESESLAVIESLIKDHGPVTVLTCDNHLSAFVTALAFVQKAGQTALNVITADATSLFQQSHAFSGSVLITIFEDVGNLHRLSADVTKNGFRKRKF